MPFGGNDWLALNPEPTLEPELPICDPHHHFWDFRTVRIPYQRYLLHELAADVNSGHNFLRSQLRRSQPDAAEMCSGGFPAQNSLAVGQRCLMQRHRFFHTDRCQVAIGRSLLLHKDSNYSDLLAPR